MIAGLMHTFGKSDNATLPTTAKDAALEASHDGLAASGTISSMPTNNNT